MAPAAVAVDRVCLRGALLLALLAAAAATASAAPQGARLDRVTLQLRWSTDTLFAGYYAAQALGYYKQFGIDVTIKPGGPKITPEQVVASGQADIGIDWLPSLLATRDTGTDLVNIAQVYARSGMTELTWKSSGITSVAKMRGKKVGVWCCGNQYELYAALAKYGMNPVTDNGVTIVNQPFDMNLFLQHKVDAAAAMTYSELAQVLETKNPRTGRLYTTKDLNIFPMQKEGTGMLEDGLFAQQRWINGNRDLAKRFIAASDRGWIYCRDHVAQCVSIVLRQGTALSRGRQTWELNEANKLIWPNAKGIGIMDPVQFEKTAATALEYKGIKHPASKTAYDPRLAKAALQYLEKHVDGIDVHGKGYRPIEVTLRAGGK